MSATSILINVGAQTAGAVRGLNSVTDALGHQATTAEKAKLSLKKMLPAALAAGGAIVTAGVYAVNAASNQQQAFGALDSVFGKNSESMKAWADQQSAIGLSAAEAGNSAVLLGSLLKNSGDSAAQAAKKSQELVGLGADLAATYGGPTTDAVDALSAAFKGEFDSLEKYGVSLKASDVQARLAAKGQDKLTGAAKKQAEAAAINELIWEQSADAQGQAGRESDTFAGAMGRLKAEVTNAAAEIGEALLPYVSQVVDKLAGFATWAKENQGVVQVIGAIILGLAGAIIALNVAMTIWTAVTTAWSVVTAVATAVGAAFGAVVAFITSPIGLIILAIVALIAIIVLLYKNWDKVKAFLARSWEWIKEKAVAIWGAIKEWFAKAWNAIKDKVVEIWNGIKAWLAEKWQAIKDKASEAFTGLKNKIAEIWDGIKESVRTKISNLIEFVKELPGRILRGIGNLGRLLYDKGRDLIQGLIDGIKSMISKIPVIGNLVKTSVPGVSGSRSYPGVARTGALSTRSGSTFGSVTVNVYGNDANANARAVKRALEGEDIRHGRKPGTPLRVAW